MAKKIIGNTYITNTINSCCTACFVEDENEFVVLRVTYNTKTIITIPLIHLYDMLTELVWKLPKEIIAYAGIPRRIRNLRLMCAIEAADTNLAKWETKNGN